MPMVSKSVLTMPTICVLSLSCCKYRKSFLYCNGNFSLFPCHCVEIVVSQQVVVSPVELVKFNVVVDFVNEKCLLLCHDNVLFRKFVNPFFDVFA